MTNWLIGFRAKLDSVKPHGLRGKLLSISRLSINLSGQTPSLQFNALRTCYDPCGFESLIHPIAVYNQSLGEATQLRNDFMSSLIACAEDISGCMTVTMVRKLTGWLNIKSTKLSGDSRNWFLTFNVILRPLPYSLIPYFLKKTSIIQAFLFHDIESFLTLAPFDDLIN